MSTAPDSTIVAAALDYSLYFLRSGLERGIQSDLYKNLKEAVQSRIAAAVTDPKEAERLNALLVESEALRKRVDELEGLVKRIGIGNDPALIQIARQVLTETPSIINQFDGNYNITGNTHKIKITEASVVNTADVIQNQTYSFSRNK